VAQRALTRDCRSAGLEKLVAKLGQPGCQGRLPVVTAVDDEYAHGHAEPRERFADSLLQFHRAAHEAVVLERGKALRRHELELRDGIRSRMFLEHAEVRAVTQFELPARFHGARTVGRQ